MIDVLDRRELRNFVHKTLGRKALALGASFVPGGSTAVSLATTFAGSGGGAPRRAGRLGKAGRKACRAGGGTVLRTPGQPTVCVQPGGRVPAGPTRPPSVPPVNPVRLAVIQAKPAPPLKPAPRPKRRVPQILPPSRPHVSVPSGLQPAIFRPRTPAPPRRQAMPIHSRIRRAIMPAFSPAGPEGCVFPARRDPLSGECRVFLGDQSGRDDEPMGQAVMGKYGAAYVPGSMIIDRAVCLPGDVVGDDGLCYPKRSIKNSDREWPRGRRPLLTGGDMRAISIAHRAGARMTRAAGRLQDMGIIKKPIVRKQIKKKS